MAEQTAGAEAWGIAPGYHDVAGHWQATPPDTAERLVAALSRGGQAPRIFDQAARVERAFQGDGARRWGLAVQLYGVRSARNWGVGDFSDLAAIVRVAGEAGAAAVGLNPLHALNLDPGITPSPYAPSSRLFLNPLYIDVEAISEFDVREIPELALRVASLRDAKLVDYAGVAALKMHALRTAFARIKNSGARRDELDKFRIERGDPLARFAAYNVLRARHGWNWRAWPQEWRAPDTRATDSLRADSEFAFHEFLQWEADRQLQRCKVAAREAGLKIGLYLDVAVGVDPNGADAWSHQAEVLGDVKIGAPPDQFNPAGQDWGLAPLNPHALEKDDFAIFREVLAAAMRHAGAIRLDHVLGLMRLFLIPQGVSSHNGAYVRYPFAALLRVVAEASRRHRCIVIGEDLGTVPDGFHDVMAQWGLWSCKVMLFERGGHGAFRPPGDYPAEALASFNTHDLATFRGWITGADLDTKRTIGVDPGESGEERAYSRDMLRAAVAGEGFDAVAAYLAATPSRLVMAEIEDLLEVAEQPNVPGTVEQHPNWRRKLPVPLEAWSEQPMFRRSAEAFRRAGR